MMNGADSSVDKQRDITNIQRIPSPAKGRRIASLFILNTNARSRKSKVDLRYP